MNHFRALATCFAVCLAFSLCLPSRASANPGRWTAIAGVYAEQGMLKPGLSLDGFLYATAGRTELRWSLWPAAGGLAAALVALLVATRFYRLNRSLAAQIVQRETVEAELRERERSERNARQLLETVFANMAQAVVLTDADFTVVAFNAHFKVLFDFSDKDLLRGVSFEQLMGVWAERYEQGEVVREKALAALRQRSLFFAEFPQYHALRGQTWIELFHNPLHEGGCVRTYTDITERKRAQAWLAASEKRYHTLFEAAPFPAVVASVREGVILFINERAAEFFEISTEEAVGQRVIDYYQDPEERTRLLDLLKREGRVLDYELGLRTAKGQPRLVAISSGLVSFAEAPAVFSSFNDITEKKRMEERLVESEEFHRTIIEAAPLGIAVADNAGQLIFYSPKHHELYGIPAGVSVVGTSALEWVHPDDRERAMHRFKQFVDGELSLATTEYKLKKYDGSFFWGLLTSTLLRDALGRPKGLLAITMDVTQRKLMEEELCAAKDAAEIANRAKSEFLANMSHEIRTHMNAVLGLSQHCLQTQTTQQQRDYLLKIRTATDTLLALVNDSLELSKIETDIMEKGSALFSPDVQLDTDQGARRPFQVLNPVALQQHLGTDEATVKAILAQFRLEYCDSVARVREALARDDYAAAKKMMHTLKGVAGNLTATRLFEAVKDLDRMLFALLDQANGPPAAASPGELVAGLERFETEMAVALADIADFACTSTAAD